MPGSSATLDESMCPFEGNLSIKQYIKNKRTRFGIKSFRVAMRAGYTYEDKIYAGKNDNKKN